MNEDESLASMLVDHAIAAHLVPWACPCDFGPGDRYRLEELVAASPHSLVYRATDKSLSSEDFNASVAIKIFREQAAVRNEALTARRITHPNVLNVLDRGTTPEGLSYLVSEFVGGGDLSQVTVPMPPRKAAVLVAKIARAVRAAHSAGIVHCDLKPANILLTKSGEPKLADFGFARWRDDNAEASRGNMAFMSPEQFLQREDALTPPSDIYSLGGLLYYLLTGKLPLGQTAEEVAAAHSERVSVPSPGVSHDLDRICLRATALSRDLRHNSAGELAADLEHYLAHEPLDWTRPSVPRRLSLWTRRKPASAVLAAAAVVAVVSLMAVLQYNHLRDQKRQREGLAEAAQVAKRDVDKLRAAARQNIKFMAEQISGSVGRNIQEEYLPAIVWIEWISNSPVVGEDGHAPGVEERKRLLVNLIATATEQGRAEHLDVLIAKFALARLSLYEGDATDSPPLLADLEKSLVPRLSPNDPVTYSIAAMKVCAEANAAISLNKPVAGFLPRLEAQEGILKQSDASEPARKLVERVLVRCRAHIQRLGG
jgi:serine/threonine protein kinase